jgi:hypothetical protein
LKKTIILPLALYAVFSNRLPAADPRPVFPTPFVVEHHVETTDETGERFRSETVTDTYGGSWLVSVHPAGKKTIVDFSRRELTEVDEEKGTYWTLTFGRMRELRQRIASAQRVPQAARVRSGNEPAHVLKVDEVRNTRALTAADVAPGARHFRASVGETPAMDAWLDAKVTLGAPALESIHAFESEALGDEAEGGAAPGDLLHAIRTKGNGAFPVRVRRSIGTRGERASEDVVTRIETLPAFPEKLVTIGAGFKRVPSPLEVVAAFEDEEEARKAGTVR